MKNKKGFISSFTIYSFFVVFILLLIVVLLTYVNKQKLLDKLKITPKFDIKNICDGKTLRECIFISYYINKLEGTIDDANNLTTALTAINNQTLDLTSSSSGLYKATDESSKTSYFFRGNITNNYVSFAGFRWRIVRINGTDNIRLILDDVYNDEVKNTLMNDTEEKYNPVDSLYDCGNTYYKYQDGSLITNFNQFSDNLVCELKDKKEKVGLMNGQSSLNKDERYGNLNNSDILNVLYNFYDKYLSSYSSYISNNDYYCANKNPLSDEDKKSNEEFKNIIKSVCKKSGWEWACSNNFANSLNDVNYKQIYYGELMNIMSYADNSKEASYVCENSGATANSVCNKALNLSTYSNNSSDRIKYAFGYSDISGRLADAIASPCGYIGRIGDNKGKIIYRDSYLQQLNNQGKIIYKGQSNYDTIVGNGSLEKPIGLISATEAYLSGAGFSSNGEYKSSISSRTFDEYWTSSAVLSDVRNSAIQEPFGKEEGLYYYSITEYTGNYYFAVNNSNNLKFTLGYIFTQYGTYNTPYARPVINLLSSVVYCSGEGTEDKPYQIALNKNECPNN